MTELLIDGVQVVLPKGFSAQVKRENALFTKNGEYTYDVTLDLTNSTNAELYRHINRLNSTETVKTVRSAVLIADNRVYCNGTEVITGWTDKTVTIQIASGNSELNYVIGGNLEIATFTHMCETDPTIQPLDFIKKTYPDVQYCLSPIYDQEADVVANRWGLQADLQEPLIASYLAGTKYAQPFLCAYIKELLKVLGYTLEVNQLENTSYKSLYICQVNHPSKWCEMLPGWTVIEFLEEIERLFEAVFVIENRGKKAALLLKSTFYTGQQNIHVQHINDIYEVEVEEKPEIEDMVDCNVSYKTDNSEFWRWRTLPELVRKRAKYGVIPADYSNHGDRIASWFEDVEHQLTNTIYKDEKTGRQYLYIRKSEVYNSPVFVMVDSFPSLDRGEVATNVELSMRPATFARVSFPLQGDRMQNSLDFSIPVMTSSGNGAEEMPESLVDIVLNNVTESSKSKVEISLAFYTGLQNIAWIFNGVKHYFPISFIDEYRLSYVNNKEWTYYKMANLTPSLRLSVMNEQFYAGGYDIDFTKGIQVNSFDPNLYNPRSIFEIRNKRYVCKEMEYTIDANGRKGSWSGTFYPIRLSDVEADARWILTDGRWRDGGVWLDSGRWLDE